MIIDAYAVVDPRAMAAERVSIYETMAFEELTGHAWPHSDCTVCNVCSSMVDGPYMAHRNFGRQISTR